MAKRTQVVLIDDIDGEELVDGGKTVTFAYEGAEYSVDLSEQNAKKLHEALQPYLEAATKVGGRRSRGTGASTGKTDLRAMREWAKENGFKVAERGRVSREVQEAYTTAS